MSPLLLTGPLARAANVLDRPCQARRPRALAFVLAFVPASCLRRAWVLPAFVPGVLTSVRTRSSARQRESHGAPAARHPSPQRQHQRPRRLACHLPHHPSHHLPRRLQQPPPSPGNSAPAGQAPHGWRRQPAVPAPASQKVLRPVGAARTANRQRQPAASAGDARANEPVVPAHRPHWAMKPASFISTRCSCSLRPSQSK